MEKNGQEIVNNETTVNEVPVVQETTSDVAEKYIPPTEEEMEIYKAKEKEIIDKYDPSIRELEKQIQLLNSKKEEELIRLQVSYPREFIEDSRRGKVIPCIVWQGKRLNGLLGHECLRIFLVREDTIERETKTGKVKEEKVFLFKNYLNVFTTFQQSSDGKKFTSDAEIYQHPVWVRIEECSDKFSVWDKESHYYLSRRETISADLFVSICDLVHTALGKDAKTLREELINLLSRDGRSIKIDEIAIIPKSRDKEEEVVDTEVEVVE